MQKTTSSSFTSQLRKVLELVKEDGWNNVSSSQNRQVFVHGQIKKKSDDPFMVIEDGVVLVIESGPEGYKLDFSGHRGLQHELYASPPVVDIPKILSHVTKEYESRLVR